VSTDENDAAATGVRHTPESAARLELALDELLTPLGSIMGAIEAARCHATRCRTAPDPVALFYDLARLDGALELLETGTARIVSIIRTVYAPPPAVSRDDDSFS
jgi:hypothetical protein